MTAAHVPQDLPGSDTATTLVAGRFPCETPEPAPLLHSLLHHSRFHRRSGSATTVDSVATQQFPKQTGLARGGSIFRKLAGPRENAKRFLRLGTAQSPAASQDPPMARARRHRPVSEIILSPDDVNMLAAPSLHPGRMRSHSSSNSSAVLPRGPSPGCMPDNTPFPALPNEKTVATGSGISVGIALTEPVLFLQGYDQNDPSSKKSAILRGQLHLKISKSVKIKKISICFRGQAQTDWPDGKFFLPPFFPFPLSVSGFEEVSSVLTFTCLI